MAFCTDSVAGRQQALYIREILVAEAREIDGNFNGEIDTVL